MKTIVSAALALAVAGAFGLGTVTTTQPAAAQTEKAQPKKAEANKGVMALQEALNRTGAGLKVDGRMGPKTRAALKDYQAKNGLKATGQLDRESRTKLGL